MPQLFLFVKKLPYRAKYFFEMLFLYKNPLQIFASYFFPDRKKTIKAELRNGLKFFLRQNVWDFFVLNELFIKKEYSVLEHDFSSPKTIIDIGAHIGSFSAYYAKKFPSAKIFCFEPMPQNFELLEKNIKENNYKKKIFAFNLAVVGKKGKELLPLYICEENPACNSLDKEYSISGSREVFVKTKRIPKNRFCDFGIP
ncbi:MAG: FkbM family methyltransferase [Candidatus Diapherotrites archaeon]|nr:FkbM family methyltransferase [Candidatus Diapherotrites archaeon]